MPAMPTEGDALVRTAERAEQRLLTLYEVALAVSQETGLAAALERIVDAALRLTGADGSQVVLWRPGDGLESVAAKGVAGGPGQRYPLGRDVTGAAFEAGHSLVVHDYPRHPLASPEGRREGLRAMLAAPLRAGGRRLGVLNVVSHTDPHAFDADEVQALTLFAEAAAAALINAQLAEEREARAQDLRRREAHLLEFQQVARAITADLDLGALLDHLLAAVLRLTDSLHARCWLLAAGVDGEVVRAAGPAAADLEAAGGPRPIDDRIVAARTPLLDNHLAEGPGHASDLSRQLGIGRLMGAPLLLEGRVEGVLTASRPDGAPPYAPGDLTVLAALADQAALALHNARRHAEVQRLAAEYRAVLEQVPSGLIVLDAQGRMVFLNEAGRRLSGTMPDQQVPVPEQAAAYQVRDPASGRLLRPEETPVGRARSGEAVSRVRYFFSPPGTHRDVLVEASAVPVRNASGAIERVVAVFTDVTAEHRQHQRREALLRVARHFAAETDAERLLASLLHEAVASVHGEMGSVYRWDEGQALLVPVQSTARVRVPMRLGEGIAGQAMAQGRTVIENHYQALEGAAPAWRAHGVQAVIAAPLLHEGRRLGALAVANRRPSAHFDAEDATVLEVLAGMAAAALARLLHTEALAQAEKLRALGQLAGGVAHDLNQSLALVVGHGDLALDALGTEPLDRHELHHLVETMVRAAMDGGESVKRLLAFAQSRIEGEAEAVDVETLLRDVARLTAPRWRDAAQAEGRPITLMVEAPPGLRVHGWPASLREALTNVVLNAVDSLPRGGAIHLAAAAHAPWVVLEVRDNGVGMPPEVQARCFEPFFTTKGERGSGLGLAQVFRIVEHHGGRVEVDSTPGRGTTVRLWLRGEEMRAEPRAPAPHQAPAARLAILVADDEPALAQAAARLLAREGHEVAVVHTGEEALRQLAVRRFDLVLSDVGMGAGMNGWDLARAVRQGWPGVAFALLTGWGSAVDPEEARAHGVRGVLSKPYRLQDLRRLVAALAAPARD